jgi:hypothetical protein
MSLRIRAALATSPAVLALASAVIATALFDFSICYYFGSISAAVVLDEVSVQLRSEFAFSII